MTGNLRTFFIVMSFGICLSSGVFAPKTIVGLCLNEVEVDPIEQLASKITALPKNERNLLLKELFCCCQDVNAGSVDLFDELNFLGVTLIRGSLTEVLNECDFHPVYLSYDSDEDAIPGLIALMGEMGKLEPVYWVVIYNLLQDYAAGKERFEEVTICGVTLLMYYVPEILACFDSKIDHWRNLAQINTTEK